MSINIYKECLHYQNKIGAHRVLGNIGVFFRQKIIGKFEVPYIELFLTTKCNLRCEKCSNLIPYLKERGHISFTDFQAQLDALLSKIDRLYRLKIHGGEVLMHPQIGEAIRYVEGCKKIKSVRIATNGTILPRAEVLEALKGSKVVIQISDYGAVSTKATELMALLDREQIKYVWLKERAWQDMGEIKRRKESRYDECSIARCTSMYRNKIYVCSRAAMMEEWGCHFYDGISIETDKKTFQRQLRGLYRGEHSKACFFCDGDTEYASKICAGEQIK